MTDWSPATLWWLAAGGLVAAELLTGTFYLLMLALGAAAGALAAHAGLSANVQLLAAALGGGGGVAAWHAWRQRRPSARPAEDAQQHLDIGCTVQVVAWSSDGTARVHHRGSDWDARYDGPDAARPGPHVIRAVLGNRLVLARPGHGATPA
jgi:membrane protein implicated in regulation of membrane protease activity